MVLVLAFSCPGHLEYVYLRNQQELVTYIPVI